MAKVYDVEGLLRRYRAAVLPSKRELGDLRRNAVFFLAVRAGSSDSSFRVNLDQSIESSRSREVPYLASLGFLAAIAEVRELPTMGPALSLVLDTRSANTEEGSGWADDSLNLCGLLLLARCLESSRAATMLESKLSAQVQRTTALRTIACVVLNSSAVQGPAADVNSLTDLALASLLRAISASLESELFPGSPQFLNRELLKQAQLSREEPRGDLAGMLILAALEAASSPLSSFHAASPAPLAHPNRSNVLNLVVQELLQGNRLTRSSLESEFLGETEDELAATLEELERYGLLQSHCSEVQLTPYSLKAAQGDERDIAVQICERLLEYLKERVCLEKSRFKEFDWNDLTRAVPPVVRGPEESTMLHVVIHLLGLCGGGTVSTPDPSTSSWRVPNDLAKLRQVTTFDELADYQATKLCNGLVDLQRGAVISLIHSAADKSMTAKDAVEWFETVALGFRVAHRFQLGTLVRTVVHKGLSGERRRLALVELTRQSLRILATCGFQKTPCEDTMYRAFLEKSLAQNSSVAKGASISLLDVMRATGQSKGEHLAAVGRALDENLLLLSTNVGDVYSAQPDVERVLARIQSLPPDRSDKSQRNHRMKISYWLWGAIGVVLLGIGVLVFRSSDPIAQPDVDEAGCYSALHMTWEKNVDASGNLSAELREQLSGAAQGHSNSHMTAANDPRMKAIRETCQSVCKMWSRSSGWERKILFERLDICIGAAIESAKQKQLQPPP